jgi:ferrous iron transport protein A
MQPSTDIDTDIDTDNEKKGAKPAKWCWFARWIRKDQGPSQNSAFAGMAQAALDTPSATMDGHGAMYRAGLTLAELKPGECGTVRRLFGPTMGRLRLLEMGLTPGTHIQVTRAAAFGGPLDILVRGYQLSLRLQEAAGVWLDDADEEAEPVLTAEMVRASDNKQPELEEF